jgi:hypothetical protein
MKLLTTILAMMLLSNICRGQTADEWLRQNKTQSKYLIEQIAALEMYMGYAHKGYSIAQNGLKTIDYLKKGEWHLHTDFFNSLDLISPEIKNYAKVADIIALQAKILHSYKNTYQQIKQNELFNAGEVDYIEQVYNILIKSCAADLDDLTSVITPRDWKLKDDERFKRIDALYISMLDKYSFAQSFGNETKVLALQRMKKKMLFKPAVP